VAFVKRFGGVLLTTLKKYVQFFAKFRKKLNKNNHESLVVKKFKMSESNAICDTTTGYNKDDLRKKDKKALQDILKGMSRPISGNKSELVDRIIQPMAENNDHDLYTNDLLRERFLQHKRYVEDTVAIRNRMNLNIIRLPNMPEDISENIVKVIIQNKMNIPSRWTKSNSSDKKVPGDLFSPVEGTQEVKCFTSDGPLSFGPNEKWNCIYFLDARNWLNDIFIVWRVELSNTSADWQSLKVNKSQTMGNQCAQKRRPRICWDAIKSHLDNVNVCHFKNIFEGKFEDIFVKAEVV